MKISLVQLSQSVKTTNVTHTLTDTQTDYFNNGTMYAPRYEEAFLPKGKKRPSSLRSLVLASLKTTNVTHTHTQTDYFNNGTLYAPRYKEAFSPEGKKRPRY